MLTITPTMIWQRTAVTSICVETRAEERNCGEVTPRGASQECGELLLKSTLKSLAPSKQNIKTSGEI